MSKSYSVNLFNGYILQSLSWYYNPATNPGYVIAVGSLIDGLFTGDTTVVPAIYYLPSVRGDYLVSRARIVPIGSH